MMGCVPHYLDLVSCFLNHLPKNFNPTSLLDLGCGNGNVSAKLLPHFPTATYTLVDASAEMIELCKKQFSDYDFRYANAYFKDFLFAEESYDMVVAGFSLHHCEVKEKQAIFKKIYASLKKGGVFACCDLMISKTNPAHPKLLEDWHQFVNHNFPDGEKWTWLMEHYKSFDRPTDYLLQKAWLEQIGFTSIQTPFQKHYWVFLQAEK